MTRFSVDIDCTAKILDDRNQARFKGGRCHRIVSGECARDIVKRRITEIHATVGSKWKGYYEGSVYSYGATCYLYNGDIDGLTDENPTRTRACKHTARGTVVVHKPGRTLIRKLNRMGFREH